MRQERFVRQEFPDHAAEHLARGHPAFAGRFLQFLSLPPRQEKR
jgi:hypothetical protein